MDTPANTIALFRASIIYTGKYADKTECAFLKAKSKEDAKKYIEKIIKNSLKRINAPEDCFKVDITPSSQDEIEFFMANRKQRNYNGLAN